MNAPVHIDARGVRDWLTRAGIDLEQQLQVEDRPTLSRVVDFDHVGWWRWENEVRVSGPETLRKAAWELLFWEAGYACAPYQDVDCYVVPRSLTHRESA